MPYGPPYDPTVPYDGVERGLLGYFINSYIENQYEFVLKKWCEAGGIRRPGQAESQMQGRDHRSQRVDRERL